MCFKNTPIYLFIIAMTLMLSCSSSTEINIDEVIAEKVEERLANFKEILDRNCKEKAYEEANQIADSIILERARGLRDTAFRPFRPLRPQQGELKILEDSLLLLEPLFDTIAPIDTLLQDTLK